VADQGVHAALEQHPRFEALPQTLSVKRLEARHHQRMAKLGVGAAHTMYDTVEILGLWHPLMKARGR
jgi:hypothetical protein